MNPSEVAKRVETDLYMCSTGDLSARYTVRVHASVAQRTEQGSSNPEVVGSSPATGACCRKGANVKKYLAILILVLAIALVSVMLVSAQKQEPVELQPYYILMDGEDKVGLVYALDGGWVLADGNDLVYTCGCDGCEVEEIGHFVPEETPGPHDTPVPTDPPPTDPPPTDPPPTDPPPTEEPKKKCNRGGGNSSEGCDPGNSGGKPGNAGEDNE